MMMEVSNNSNNNNHHHQKRIRINNIQIGFIVLIVLCTFSNIIPTTKFNNSSFLFRGGDRTISTGGGGEKINNNNNNETGLAMTVDTSSSSSSSSPLSPSMISNQNDVLLPPTTTTSTSSSFIISNVQNHGVNNNNNQNITTTTTTTATTTTTSIIIPSAKKDHNDLLFIAPRQQTFNNMSLNRSLEILQDLGGGKNVEYNGANLICINKFKINGKDFNINNKNNKTKTNNKAKAIIRKPEIYWYDYRQQQQQQQSNNNNLSSSSSSIRSSRRNSRVLIAQSAGFGKYGNLLDATVPITKAYARRWNMTVLIIQGSLVVMDEERKQNCIPGEHRSTHNKMQILQYALHHRDQFDYVLLLDADALIYKFSIDISTLFYNTTTTTYNSTINTTTTTPDKFLLAHRIGGRNDGTWKVNAGVTLWYLQHPNLPILINAWQRSALGYFNTRNNDSGDQQFLYHALKNNPNNLTLSANVYGLDKEFQYNKGSVIKHIKRPKLSYQPGKTKVDERRSTIDKFINEICSKKFPKDCERLDYFNYSQV